MSGLPYSRLPCFSVWRSNASNNTTEQHGLGGHFILPAYAQTRLVFLHCPGIIVYLTIAIVGIVLLLIAAIGGIITALFYASFFRPLRCRGVSMFPGVHARSP